MKRYVLDTSIALAYIRGHELYAQVEADLTLTSPDTQVLISVVNKAELLVLGRTNNWGQKKLSKLNHILSKLLIIDIREADKKMMECLYKNRYLQPGKIV